MKMKRQRVAATIMVHLDKCLLEHVSSWLSIVDLHCLLRVCKMVQSLLLDSASRRLGSCLFDSKMLMKIQYFNSARFVRRLTIFLDFSFPKHLFTMYPLPGLEWLEVFARFPNKYLHVVVFSLFTDKLLQYPNLRVVRLSLDGVNWGRLPEGLEEIHLDSTTFLRLPQFPTGLLRLDLTGCHPVDLPSLPPGLTHFAIDNLFDLPPLPDTLTHLDILGDDFDKHFKLPPNLVHLSLGHKFNKPFSSGSFSSNLRSLHLGREFNHSLEGVLPEGLTNLHVSTSFSIPFLQGHLPSTLTTLCVPDSYGFFGEICAPRNMRKVFVRARYGGKFLPNMLNFPDHCLHLLEPLGMHDYLYPYHDKYAYATWWRSSHSEFLSRNGRLVNDDPEYLPIGEMRQDIDLADAGDPIVDTLALYQLPLYKRERAI